jgi:hypothetical protein
VRLLEAAEPAAPPSFFADGFTKKLKFKAHPYQNAPKHLLSGIDRHCVATTEQLHRTPHAMTAQDLMSGARHARLNPQLACLNSFQPGLGRQLCEASKGVVIHCF